jgi:hypothetical protein
LYEFDLFGGEVEVDFAPYEQTRIFCIVFVHVGH